MPYPKQKYPIIICEICNKSFKVPPSRLKQNPRFCSVGCKYKWFKGSEQSPRVKTKCLTCSKPMRVYKIRYENDNRGRYCSQKCMIAQRPTTPRKPRVRCICKNCSKIFFRLPCQIKDSNRGRFCSRPCVIAHTNKNMRGNRPTSIEQAIQKELNKLELDYEIQYTGLPPWVIDFAFPGNKLAVEVDGVYWHSLENVKEKDKRKDKDLRNQGWQIIHFTGDEVRQSPSNCVKKIIHILKQKTA